MRTNPKYFAALIENEKKQHFIGNIFTYPGRCFAEHTDVYAPGRPKITAFLSFKST